MAQDFQRPEGQGRISQNIRSLANELDRQSPRQSIGTRTSVTSRGTFRSTGTKRPEARNSPAKVEVVSRWA